MQLLVLPVSSSDRWRSKGYFWLRGLPDDDPELLRGLFWVIGNNLGVPTMQNKRGQVLSEVFDRFDTWIPRSLRPPTSRQTVWVRLPERVDPTPRR